MQVICKGGSESKTGIVELIQENSPCSIARLVDKFNESFQGCSKYIGKPPPSADLEPDLKKVVSGEMRDAALKVYHELESLKKLQDELLQGIFKCTVWAMRISVLSVTKLDELQHDAAAQTPNLHGLQSLWDAVIDGPIKQLQEPGMLSKNLRPEVAEMLANLKEGKRTKRDRLKRLADSNNHASDAAKPGEAVPANTMTAAEAIRHVNLNALDPYVEIKASVAASTRQTLDFGAASQGDTILHRKLRVKNSTDSMVHFTQDGSNGNQSFVIEPPSMHLAAHQTACFGCHVHAAALAPGPHEFRLVYTLKRGDGGSQQMEVIARIKIERLQVMFSKEALDFGAVIVDSTATGCIEVLNRTTVSIPIKAGISCKTRQASVTVSDPNELIQLAPQCVHRYHISVMHAKEEGVDAKLIVGVGGPQHLKEIAIRARFRKAHYELLDDRGNRVPDRALVEMGDTTPGHLLERVLRLRNIGEVSFVAQAAVKQTGSIFTCKLGSSTRAISTGIKVPPQFTETLYIAGHTTTPGLHESEVRVEVGSEKLHFRVGMAVGTADLTVQGSPEIEIDLRDPSKILGPNGALKRCDLPVTIRNRDKYVSACVRVPPLYTAGRKHQECKCDPGGIVEVDLKLSLLDLCNQTMRISLPVTRATKAAIDFDVAIKIKHQPVVAMETRDRTKASNVFLKELRAGDTLKQEFNLRNVGGDTALTYSMKFNPDLLGPTGLTYSVKQTPIRHPGSAPCEVSCVHFTGKGDDFVDLERGSNVATVIGHRIEVVLTASPTLPKTKYFVLPLTLIARNEHYIDSDGTCKPGRKHEYILHGFVRCAADEDGNSGSLLDSSRLAVTPRDFGCIPLCAIQLLANPLQTSLFRSFVPPIVVAAVTSGHDLSQVDLAALKAICESSPAPEALIDFVSALIAKTVLGNPSAEGQLKACIATGYPAFTSEKQQLTAVHKFLCMLRDSKAFPASQSGAIWSAIHLFESIELKQALDETAACILAGLESNSKIGPGRALLVKDSVVRMLRQQNVLSSSSSLTGSERLQSALDAFKAVVGRSTNAAAHVDVLSAIIGILLRDPMHSADEMLTSLLQTMDRLNGMKHVGVWADALRENSLHESWGHVFRSLLTRDEGDRLTDLLEGAPHIRLRTSLELLQTQGGCLQSLCQALLCVMRNDMESSTLTKGAFELIPRPYLSMALLGLQPNGKPDVPFVVREILAYLAGANQRMRNVCSRLLKVLDSDAAKRWEGIQQQSFAVELFSHMGLEGDDISKAASWLSALVQGIKKERVRRTSTHHSAGQLAAFLLKLLSTKLPEDPTGPVPPEWAAAQSNLGFACYCNERTGESAWRLPSVNSTLLAPVDDKDLQQMYRREQALTKTVESLLSGKAAPAELLAACLEMCACELKEDGTSKLGDMAKPKQRERFLEALQSIDLRQSEPAEDLKNVQRVLVMIGELTGSPQPALLAAPMQSQSRLNAKVFIRVMKAVRPTETQQLALQVAEAVQRANTPMARLLQLAPILQRHQPSRWVYHLGRILQSQSGMRTFEEAGEEVCVNTVRNAVDILRLCGREVNGCEMLMHALLLLPSGKGSKPAECLSVWLGLMSLVALASNSGLDPHSGKLDEISSSTPDHATVLNAESESSKKLATVPRTTERHTWVPFPDSAPEDASPEATAERQRSADTASATALQQYDFSSASNVTEKVSECTALIAQVKSTLQVERLHEATLKSDVLQAQDLVDGILQLRKAADEWSSLFAQLAYFSRRESDVPEQDVADLFYGGLTILTLTELIRSRLADSGSELTQKYLDEPVGDVLHKLRLLPNQLVVVQELVRFQKLKTVNSVEKDDFQLPNFAISSSAAHASGTDHQPASKEDTWEHQVGLFEVAEAARTSQHAGFDTAGGFDSTAFERDGPKGADQQAPQREQLKLGEINFQFDFGGNVHTGAAQHGQPEPSKGERIRKLVRDIMPTAQSSKSAQQPPIGQRSAQGPPSNQPEVELGTGSSVEGSQASALLQKVSIAQDMDSTRRALQEEDVYALFEKAKQVSRDYDPSRIATESSLKIDPKQSEWTYKLLAKTSCKPPVRMFSTLLPLSLCASDV